MYGTTIFLFWVNNKPHESFYYWKFQNDQIEWLQTKIYDLCKSLVAIKFTHGIRSTFTEFSEVFKNIWHIHFLDELFMSYSANTLKEYCYMIDFVLQAKVNNSSLIGLGYTQILKPGMYRWFKTFFFCQ